MLSLTDVNDARAPITAHRQQRPISGDDDVGFGSERAIRPDGRVLTYTWNGSAWASDADVLERLAQFGANWTLTLPDDRVETYGPDGVLASVRDRAGLSHTLAYSAGRLTRVTHSYGQVLDLTYDAQGRLAGLTTPDGQALGYAYDAAGKLAGVTYPGTLTRRYHYNEAAHTGGANLPHALTGLTDERGIRVSTWTYAPDGRATGSSRSGGVDAYTLAYQPDGSTRITDPLGSVRAYSFAVQQQVARLAGLSQPCTSGCGDTAQALTRDANGNPTARRGFNGNLTCATYDLSRNLETRPPVRAPPWPASRAPSAPSGTRPCACRCAWPSRAGASPSATTPKATC